MKPNTKEKGIVLKSLLAAWITVVFGTSILLAAFTTVDSSTYHPNAFLNFLRQVWEIADEMGPAVKISLILMFTLLTYCIKSLNLHKSKALAYLINMSLACVAVALVLAFLPAGYSRGFGIGLTGIRFDKSVLPYYLMGALLEGFVFTYVYHRLSYKAIIS